MLRVMFSAVRRPLSRQQAFEGLRQKLRAIVRWDHDVQLHIGHRDMVRAAVYVTAGMGTGWAQIGGSSSMSE